MRSRVFHRYARGIGFGVVLIAGLILTGSFLLLLVGLPGMSGFNGMLMRVTSPLPDPSKWGLEVEIARLTAARRETGPQKAWDVEDIRNFVTSFSTGLSKAEEDELARVIHEECQAYGFAPRFVLSVIATESAFITKSVSSKGAVGLMQLRPHVAKSLADEVDLPWRGKESLYQPGVNVRLGMRYLFHLILRYRDLSLALSAYNMGPARLDGLLRRAQEPPYQYVRKVIGLYGAL
jgi:hypothetical protein